VTRPTPAASALPIRRIKSAHRVRTRAECGTDPRSACQTASGDNYVGGYCFMEPCNDIEVCPPGGTCVSLGGETPGCFKACATDADCRVAEGYLCQLFLTTPPIGFGPSDHACAFKCTRDSTAKAPRPGNLVARSNAYSFGEVQPLKKVERRRFLQVLGGAGLVGCSGKGGAGPPAPSCGTLGQVRAYRIVWCPRTRS